MVVSVWRLVNTLLLCVRVVVLPVHGVILSFAFSGSVHPSLRICVGAGLHLFFDSVFYFAGLF
jgi:hypothetical protein